MNSMTETMPQQIGKYPIIRELGSGATGRVFLANDPFVDREVAIKVIRTSGKGDPQVIKRYERLFLNEAALVGKFMHPHIVAIYDAVAEDKASYIVMEYIEGTTLEPYCSADTLLPMDQVIEIVFKANGALEYAHRNGVIHRDIKPANILIRGLTDIKITDFGVAQFDQEDQTQIVGIGSPAYMSPEQVQEKQLTHQTDIYSMGVVMYQLLTARLPFTASNKASLIYQIANIDPVSPSVYRNDIPPDLEAIIMRALQKDLHKRYESCQQFSQELVSVFKNLDLPKESISDTEKFAVLKGMSFFKNFREIEIWETLRVTAWHRVAVDYTIIREGDEGDCFYIITSGEAKVMKGNHLLNILRPGDCFGEMLYFAEGNARRSTSIIALSPMVVMEIKAASLKCASDACQVQFNKAFMRILIDRLNWANARLSAT